MNHARYPEQDERIRKMWSEGLSTIDIGRRLGRSKNSIIGHVHRLGLPPRQSPIKPRDAAQPQASIPVGMLRPAGALKAIRERRTLAPIELPPAPLRPQMVLFARGGTLPSVQALVPTTPARTCQFPSWGDDEKPTHIYCAEPVERDESGAPTGAYCGACRRRCYVRTRRQEWAA